MIFSWVFELTPNGIRRDDEVPREESIAPQTARKMDRMIIAILALALLYFGFDKFVLTPRREAAIVASVQEHYEARTIAKSLTASNDESIAILPLTNESGDKDQQFFSNGLSENFIRSCPAVAGDRSIAPDRVCCAFKIPRIVGPTR